MTSKCINDCVIINDAVRVRPTFANLHKWPEAEAEFIRSISRGSVASPQTKAMDTISCRQMYLRSYTFTRNNDGGDDNRNGGGGGGADDVADCRKDHKCFGGKPNEKKKRMAVVKGLGSRRLGLWNVKTTSRRALMTKMVRKWMFCATTSKVDADQ